MYTMMDVYFAASTIIVIFNMAAFFTIICFYNELYIQITKHTRVWHIFFIILAFPSFFLFYVLPKFLMFKLRKGD